MCRTPCSIHGLPRLCKKKWQPLADAVSLYGSVALDLFSVRASERYECFVGLAWGASRQRLRYSVSIASGIGLGLSPQWPREVFIALADDEEEGEYQFQRHEALAAMDAANRDTRQPE